MHLLKKLTLADLTFLGRQLKETSKSISSAAQSCA